ncbi:adhesion protein FadA [Fusobacterium sp. PH5-44]|uniref:adhesion protein FadA n=1 Tax=unclassified Fusobacterium TaxID=2648384 RepID=UPI003D238880
MKKLLILGSILLIGITFGNEMMSRLYELEQGLITPQDCGESYYDKQKEIALIAQEELKSMKVMYDEVAAKEKALSGRKGEQYKELAAQYKDMKKELEAGIKANEKVIAEFNAMNKK